MNTPSLPFDLPVPARKPKHHGVQSTSVAAYRHANPSSRMSVVTGWLWLMQRRYGVPPTSAEIADWANGSLGMMSWDAHILYVRIGLSDAKRKGLVENCGKRKCKRSGKTALLWRIASR